MFESFLLGPLPQSLTLEHDRRTQALTTMEEKGEEESNEVGMKINEIFPFHTSHHTLAKLER